MQEIKRLVTTLTPAECHAIAVHCLLQYVSHQPAPVFGATTNILAAKAGASQVFAKPAAEWGLLDTYCADLRVVGVNWHQCSCACGCNNMSGSLGMCLSCGTYCCNQCRPFHGQKFTMSQWSLGYPQDVECCHKCARRPKSDVELDAFRPMLGLDWYFQFPCEGFPIAETPCAWCNPNRECRADPRLHDIVSIYKFRVIESQDRRVRPLNWQMSFVVTAVLADAIGATKRVRINMFNLVMNKQWAEHPLIKHVENWLPSNLFHVGDVLKPPVVHRELPPAPPSPVTLSLIAELESTVRVEEVESEEEGDSSIPQEILEAYENVKRARHSL